MAQVYYVQYFEDALVEKCGYKGTTPYWDWTLGTITTVAHSGDPGFITGLALTIFT